MIRRASLVLALLCLFVSSGQLLELRSIDVHNHVSLVADVHDYYKTSCVMLIKSGNYNDPSAAGQMHSWFLQLSRRGILSVASTFSKLANKIEKYYNRISRPLFVVFLDTNESINEFALATGTLRISFPIWLVLFTQQPGNPLNEFCQRPKGNPFNLIFSTEMLVLCYDDPILKEWYAQSDKRTKFSDLGSWSPKASFIPFSKKSLYARRGDMFGKTMRIITAVHSVYVELNNGVLKGFMGEVVMELGAVMNFSTEIGESFEMYGSWDEEKGAWAGAMGEIVAGRVDLGVGDFSPTSLRVKAVDFTIPLALTLNKMYFKQPSNSVVALSQYFKTFDVRTWAVVMGIIATAPILLTVIKMRGSISTKLIIESYVQIWGIYCQQGLPEFPAETSLRVAFFAIFISAYVVFSAYSAALISYLTVANNNLPFNTLQGFANDGTYKLIVLKDTANFKFLMNTQDSFFRRFRPLMKKTEELPYTLLEAYTQICADRAGFQVAEATTDGFKLPIPCKLVYIEAGNTESLAMILSKNSPYTGLINYHLQRFQDYGILSKLRSLLSSRAVSQESESESESKLDAITIWGFAPIFSVLVAGIIVGCFLVLVEKMVFWKLNKSEASGLYAQETPSGILVTPKLPCASMSVNRTDLRDCDQLIMKSDYEMLRFGYHP